MRLAPCARQPREGWVCGRRQKEGVRCPVVFAFAFVRERENVHMAARRLGRSAYPTVAGRAGGATVTGVRPVLVIGLVAEGDAARVFGAQRIARGLGVAVCCGNDAIRTGAFHIRRVRRVS